MYFSNQIQQDFNCCCGYFLGKWSLYALLTLQIVSLCYDENTLKQISFLLDAFLTLGEVSSIYEHFSYVPT